MGASSELEDNGLRKKKWYGDGGSEGAGFAFGGFVKSWQENGEEDERGEGGAAPPTAEGIHRNRGKGLPDRKFLRGAGSGGVKARYDWAEKIDAVGGIVNGRSEVLVAVDGVAHEGPTERVEPEEDYGKD